MPAFQSLKRKLAHEWMPELMQLVQMDTDQLPVLWDCDFLLGPKNAAGEDTYVLCEINVSSVAPFPDSVVPWVAQSTVGLLESRRRR